jgi:Polyketide cyclase / dehydrase and lipid transport
MANPPSETMARACIEIAAPPEKVYDLVVDVSHMGRWSPEATGTIGHPDHLRPGSRFWGLNRKGVWRWFTLCTVRVADRGKTFEFDVDFWPAGVSRWRYDFRPTETGCEVTETWEDRRTGLRAVPIEFVGGIMIPGPRAQHNQWSIETTLQRLKAAAES